MLMTRGMSLGSSELLEMFCVGITAVLCGEGQGRSWGPQTRDGQEGCPEGEEHFPPCGSGVRGAPPTGWPVTRVPQQAPLHGGPPGKRPEPH